MSEPTQDEWNMQIEIAKVAAYQSGYRAGLERAAEICMMIDKFNDKVSNPYECSIAIREAAK